MNPSDIIRAWKDPNYRAGLPVTQLAQLPAHPAGAIELPEPTLHAASPHRRLPRQVGPPRGVRSQTDKGPKALLAPLAPIAGRTTCRSPERRRRTPPPPVPGDGGDGPGRRGCLRTGVGADGVVA